MSQQRPLTGKDAAGVGALPLAVNALSAAAGALVRLMLAGFFIGFSLGITVVSKRFRHL